MGLSLPQSEMYFRNDRGKNLVVKGLSIFFFFVNQLKAKFFLK